MIEVAGFYRTDLPNFQKDPESLQHYYYYEMGRNYFVFGDRHCLFTTGYVVFMRYVCMDRLGCKDVDVRTRKTIERCEEVYAESNIAFIDAFTNLGLGEKASRLKDGNGRTIRTSDQPVMYATAMLKLMRDYGGDKWVKEFYHTLRKCKLARAKSVSTAQTQLFNWLVCSSIAARKNLTPPFADRWTMPLTQEQRKIMKQTDWTAEDVAPQKLVTELTKAN